MTKGMHFGAGPLLFVKAKELRNRMTPSELVFWRLLKESFSMHKFRRQHPVSIYIVDFYCHQLKLVVEIDGSIHDHPDNIENDIKREKNLESLGLNIIRFTNDEILESIELVSNKLSSIITTLANSREFER